MHFMAERILNSNSPINKIIMDYYFFVNFTTLKVVNERMGYLEVGRWTLGRIQLIFIQIQKRVQKACKLLTETSYVTIMGLIMR